MKSLYKLPVILLGVALYTKQAQAQQQDYVITSKGDTIFAEIHTSFFSASYRSPGANSVSVKITPETIKEVYIAEKNLLSRSAYKSGKSKPMFFPVIEKGKICLYEVENYNGKMSSVSWYVSKGTDTAYDIKTSSLLVIGRSRKSRKDVFVEMISDNKEVYDKYVADNKFNFRAIRNLVHLYNTGEPLPPEPEETDDSSN